jgi:hypothetical protein
MKGNTLACRSGALFSESNVPEAWMHSTCDMSYGQRWEGAA